MLNTKRNINNNVYNGSKSRNKSIYRGDQSHTLSMHIRIDNQVSPDKVKIMPDFQLQHKFSHKQNKIQAFRQSLKMNQPIFLGKRSQREDLETNSSKKLKTAITLETERPLKQSMNLSYHRKQSSKLQRQKQKQKQKSVHSSQKVKSKQNVGRMQEEDKIAISYDQLKNVISSMRRLADQNATLKKQLSFLIKSKNTPGNSVAKALLP